MKEKLLQYIWRYRYFNQSELKTTDGEPLTIINPGSLNTDQGPDFLNARIKIGDTQWVGHVEVHIFSKDWNRHNHQTDPNYKNVVLHVVWQHDADIKDASGNNLPTLELQSRVSKILLEKYEALMEKEWNSNLSFIPCQNLLPPIEEVQIISWKSRLVAERLERKTKVVFEILEKTGYHWEETLWQMIAGNFGGKINGAFFRKVAESVPQKVLALHKNQLIAIEAILFGQAGLLNGDFNDKYPQLLKREYEHYKKKYTFQNVDGMVQFARMRPANFPTLRLAQLAALITKSSHLFSKIKETGSLKELKQYFESTEPNEFWAYHYKLDDDPHEERNEKPIGKQMIENIIINTVAPVLFAYGIHNDEGRLKEKVLEWLEEVAPEKNSITSGFQRLGFKNENAFDSQALLELKNSYCNERRCMECRIGHIILSQEKAK
ncbi:MAG: DUF2851 family protein [Chitinophagaceae bacterium]|nr:DUF2851 family protein [Chitinophagaceae bacterium]